MAPSRTQRSARPILPGERVQPDCPLSGVVKRGGAKLTKAQADWLRYLSKPHTGGRVEISGIRDLEMADRLAGKGFARIYETRPGFYAVAITDTGRGAVAKVEE